MIIKLPNILVAGTPGTGKTSICQQLIEQLNDNYVYLNIASYVKEHELYSSFDKERDCVVIDDDALIDHLTEYLKEESKSVIFDYHGCDLFEPEWIQAIFVLRTTSDILYQRLEGRGYDASKVQENVQCEIFQTILDEATEAFGEEDNIEIFELQNDNESDREQNLRTILTWIDKKK